MKSLNDIKPGDWVRWKGEVPRNPDGSIDGRKMQGMHSKTSLSSPWVPRMEFILDKHWHKLKFFSCVVEGQDTLLRFSTEDATFKYAWSGYIEYLEFCSAKGILKGLIEND